MYNLTILWTEQEETVLMYAIKAKMEALCYKLIEKGADINAKSVCTTISFALTHASGT